MSSSFFEDYKALVELPKDERAKVAAFVGNCTAEGFEGADLQTFGKDLAAPADKFERIARVAVFLANQFRRVAHDIQTADQLHAAIGDVFEDAGDRQIIVDLLEPSLQRAAEVELAYGKHGCLRSGNARIVGTEITCDLRPVFRVHSEEEDSDPVILDWMPVATLELISKLNDIERNHLFLLDKPALLKLNGRLKRALSKLDMLERAREALPSRQNTPAREREGNMT